MRRIAGLDGGQIAYQALVRVPFGTVLWEEVAFRGVLLAALRAAVVAAGGHRPRRPRVFGIWHIRPTLERAGGQRPRRRARRHRRRRACWPALGTAAAGVLFTVLRLRSGSLLAPALLHLATNSLGTLAAAAAVRLS